MLVQAGRKLHSWCYTYIRKRQSQKTQRADEGRRTGHEEPKKIRRRVKRTVTRIHGARFGLQEPPLRKPHSGPRTFMFQQEVQKELTLWCSKLDVMGLGSWQGKLAESEEGSMCCRPSVFRSIEFVLVAGCTPIRCRVVF